MGYKIIMKSLRKVKKKVCKTLYEINTSKVRWKKKIYTTNMCNIDCKVGNFWL